MRILVYEFITGGGWHSVAHDAPPKSLVAEGRAMLAALAEDFAAQGDVRVDVLADRRFAAAHARHITSHEVASAADERSTLQELAAAADWTVVIAPEFDGHLLARVRWVEEAGGRLLSPSPDVVELASDKQSTAEYLAARGVPVPLGVPINPGERLPRDFPYPAVLKPCDGAGSQGIEWVAGPEGPRPNIDRRFRLEAYRTGLPASVACLCGPAEIVPLAPCRQYLSEDCRFVYCGGELPLPAPLAVRAARLAAGAVATLASPLGYLGVDLVLGDNPDGAQDVVVEINPRLTTSYVGLRALARDNLAEAMLSVAQVLKVELSWRSGPIQFEPTGRTTHAGALAQAS